MSSELGAVLRNIIDFLESLGKTFIVTLIIYSKDGFRIHKTPGRDHFHEIQKSRFKIPPALQTLRKGPTFDRKVTVWQISSRYQRLCFLKKHHVITCPPEMWPLIKMEYWIIPQIKALRPSYKNFIFEPLWCQPVPPVPCMGCLPKFFPKSCPMSPWYTLHVQSISRKSFCRKKYPRNPLLNSKMYLKKRTPVVKFVEM